MKKIFLFLVLAIFSAILIIGLQEKESIGKMNQNTQKATFGAGCFWGVEKFFWKVDGVVSTQVGYAGGALKNPTYEQVCSGTTGHAEVIEVEYDPSQVSYNELLITFWKYHDPTTLNRQGPDIGTQYRSAIFYHSPEQESQAKESIRILNESGIYKNPIVTEVSPASTFYRAEEYHQKYLKKNPNGYCSHVLQSPKIERVLKEALAI